MSAPSPSAIALTRAADARALGWNPRYFHYARVHGRTPTDQKSHDAERWPLACTLPYVDWNTARLREFRALRPDCFTSGGLANHAAYDDWLAGLPVGHGVEATA